MEGWTSSLHCRYIYSPSLLLNTITVSTSYQCYSSAFGFSADSDPSIWVNADSDPDLNCKILQLGKKHIFKNFSGFPSPDQRPCPPLQNIPPASINWYTHRASVTDPGFGDFLTPGSGILNKFFPDPVSQTHIFEILVTVFSVKKY